ncbi:MAG TPA: hypothetical protein VFC30_09500 [Solirubrobacteraceae bacterium]|nr:hypothetical protein [Solirubrobacteraceae bacterium]
MQNHGNVLVPAEMVDPVRDGLRSQIVVAAQQLATADEPWDAREHPERYQDPLRYMDAVRALLEEIGRSRATSDLSDDLQIDLRVHAWALIEALRDQISVHEDMLRDISQEDERRAAVTREMNALMILALTVLLRTQAHNLCDTTFQDCSE